MMTASLKSMTAMKKIKILFAVALLLPTFAYADQTVRIDTPCKNSSYKMVLRSDPSVVEGGEVTCNAALAVVDDDKQHYTMAFRTPTFNMIFFGERMYMVGEGISEFKLYSYGVQTPLSLKKYPAEGKCIFNKNTITCTAKYTDKGFDFTMKAEVSDD